jgi:hypothetical protein
MLDEQLVNELFERYKDLDSATFVEIPKKEIVEPSKYRFWLIGDVETSWMEKFNQKNKDYYPDFDFNRERGISGFFGELYISGCKFYRYDGTFEGFSDDDYRAKRGFLIRDHYSNRDVVKVQIITDNLTEFLQQEKIEYKRTDFKKRA